MNAAPPPPVRIFVQPEPGEGWDALIERVAREGRPRVALDALLAWNPHLAYRPPSNPLTPLDIVFLEPPR
ncbi:MAG: hypothetical protein R3F21_10395 [Myxococcota bacterium]